MDISCGIDQHLGDDQPGTGINERGWRNIDIGLDLVCADAKMGRYSTERIPGLSMVYDWFLLDIRGRNQGLGWRDIQGGCGLTLRIRGR